MRLNWTAFALTAVFVCGCQEPNKPSARDLWNHTSTPAKLVVAQNQLEQGQLDKAEQTIGDCLKAEPDNPQVNIMAGRVRLAARQTESAREFFQKAVEIDDTAADGWFGLGIIAQDTGDNAKALEHYRKAMQISPQRIEYVLAAARTLALLEQTDQGLALLDEQLSKTGGDAQLLCAAAQLARKAGQTDKARDYYCRAMIVNPADTSVMFSLAELYLSQGQWAQAADIYEKLLPRTQGTQKQECLRNIADCSLNAGRYSQALNFYDRLSVELRQDADIWLGMAKSALGAGDARRAKYSAQKALTIRSGWNEAFAVLGCAQYLGGEYSDAAGTFDSLTADPDLCGFAWLMNGQSLQKLGKTAQAKDAFARAEKINPDSELVRLMAGEKKM
jgi:Tfp pilus assembly protein PilF